MPKHECNAHHREPAPTYADDNVCYGELWTCLTCGHEVCAGYGAADLFKDCCDACFALITKQNCMAGII